MTMLKAYSILITIRGRGVIFADNKKEATRLAKDAGNYVTWAGNKMMNVDVSRLGMASSSGRASISAVKETDLTREDFSNDQINRYSGK